MRSVNDDVTVDGWLALCVAILKGVPQQEAFRLLDKPFGNRRWQEEDFREIEHLKKQGKSWKYIGEMIGSDGGTAFRQYHHWKDRQKKCK